MSAEKPVVKLVGEDGNIFNLVGICTRALRRAKQPDKAQELWDRVTQSKGYDEALGICLEYVTEAGMTEE